MPISSLLLGALAVLPGQEAQVAKPELLQFAQLARLPLEPVESPLGRSVFVVGKRTTSGSTFVAAVDGTTGERRWKFEIEGGPVPYDRARGVTSRHGAMLVVRQSHPELGRQRTLVLDATDGKLLRKLTLPAFESCVALDVEPDGTGSCTTIDLAGFFHRRDLRTGDERAQGGWYCDGLVAQGVQVPDETGDGVPELVSLAADNDGLSLHAFDGVTLERRRSVHLKERFKEFENVVEVLGPELHVLAMPLGIRLRVSEWGFNESRHALLDVPFSGVCARRDLFDSEALVLTGSSLARLNADRDNDIRVGFRFFTTREGVLGDVNLSAVQLRRPDAPMFTERWLSWIETHHGDSTFWLTFPSGSQDGDEPVLAAFDVATGREVWKSENLLR
jgi:hypothetical protein